jgi:hypothetical protein
VTICASCYASHNAARRRHVVGAALVFLLLGLTYVLWVWHRASLLPTDRDLRELFQRQQDTFEKMREMIQSEPFLRGVGPDFLSVDGHPPHSYWLHRDEWSTNDDNDARRTRRTEETLTSVKLSPDRYHEYLAALEAVNARRLEWDHHIRSWPEAVRVTIVMRGLVPSGQSKSIEYFPNGFPPHYALVGDSDARPDLKGNWYSSLGAGWYIHLHRW